jgi:hypothetical protein
MRWVSMRVGDPLYERIRRAAEEDQRSISNWLAFEITKVLDDRDRERKRQERPE